MVRPRQNATGIDVSAANRVKWPEWSGARTSKPVWPPVVPNLRWDWGGCQEGPVIPNLRRYDEVGVGKDSFHSTWWS